CYSRPVSLPRLRSFPTRRSSDLTAQIAQGQPDTVICNTVLRKIVSADLLTAIPGPHLALPLGVVGFVIGFLLLLQQAAAQHFQRDRKSTRLNSSHVSISYAVFCL